MFVVSSEEDWAEKVTVESLKVGKPLKLMMNDSYFTDAIELINWKIVQTHNNICTSGEDLWLADSKILVRATSTTFPHGEQAAVHRIFHNRGFSVNCYVSPSDNVFCHKCYKTKKLCSNHVKWCEARFNETDDLYYCIEWSYM